MYVELDLEAHLLYFNSNGRVYYSHFQTRGRMAIGEYKRKNDRNISFCESKGIGCIESSLEDYIYGKEAECRSLGKFKVVKGGKKRATERSSS